MQILVKFQPFCLNSCDRERYSQSQMCFRKTDIGINCPFSSCLHSSIGKRLATQSTVHLQCLVKIIKCEIINHVNSLYILYFNAFQMKLNQKELRDLRILLVSSCPINRKLFSMSQGKHLQDVNMLPNTRSDGHITLIPYLTI